MKVLILGHEYPPYIFGGVAYYTKELAEYLASQGFIVNVVAGRSRKPFVELKNNVRIARVSFPNIPIRSFWYSLASRSTVLKLAESADYIIFNAGSAGFLPIWLHRSIKGKRLIPIFHGTIHSLTSYLAYVEPKDKLEHTDPFDILYYMSFSTINTVLNHLELKYSHYIVAVAQHVIRELAQIYPGLSQKILTRSLIVHGGVDYDYFSHIYEYYRESADILKKDRIIYAYVGRLYLTKGAHYAIKAFELIQKELKEKTELWIFGKGPLEKHLARYSKRKNLNVKLYGLIPREKLIQLLTKHVSLLLFPSLYEGCPYILIESNAVGVPVIAWDLPWSREFVINNVNGYRTKPFSLEELAEYSIRALSLNSDEVHRYATKFDKKRHFSKIKKILTGDSH
ncbi:MAG: glycosyltransferase family 4 protein [Nitrososphaerota archaeon]